MHLAHGCRLRPGTGAFCYAAPYGQRRQTGGGNHQEAIMIYAYAKALTMAFPQEGQTVQPAKLREAKSFSEVVGPRSRDLQLFHAWRP
jgi:hypothetical protein